mgnify:CR=1 FL=1
MKVKIKKLHPDAVIPAYAKAGDAGMDLTAVTLDVDEFGNMCYGTGLAFEIPEGYVGLVFPRSSIYKKGIVLSNSVGVIDSGYRGEVSFKFKADSDIVAFAEQGTESATYTRQPCPNRDTYKLGDRIGQIIIMPYPQIEFEEVGKLSETERGTGGYGHTGE